jgi:NAD(P)-dependent dehydrogenase (short-subunit alcohol dehydrogenase family)
MSGVVIVGAGPGLGASIARRFAREGMSVGLIARRDPPLDRVVSSLGPVAVSRALADTADEHALAAALDKLSTELGGIECLVYNAAIIQQDAPGDLSSSQHQMAWAVNVVGAMTAATHVASEMARRGRGSIILTGGMPVPVASYTSLSLGKAGVRALTTMLADIYGPQGIHVATVTVGGHISPGTVFDPDEIADRYWLVHREPVSEWSREIDYSG